MPDSIKKIAIVRTSSLGDVIISASFLSYIRAKISSHITWIIDKRFADILVDSPLIDDLVVLDLKHDILGSYRTLKSLGSFDLVIDFQGLIKSAIITYILKAKDKFGYSFTSAKEGLASAFYTHKTIIKYEENILKRHIALIDDILRFYHIAPTQDLNEILQYRAKSFGYKECFPLEDSKTYKILLVLESSKKNKEYKRFDELLVLCKELPLSFYVIYHSDFAYANALCQSNSNATLLPKMNFSCVKSVISKIDLVIGGDTGITHLAWAMSRDSITLYGNTPKERFALYGHSNLTLSGNENATYSKKDFSINLIDPKNILKSIEKIYNIKNKISKV